MKQSTVLARYRVTFRLKGRKIERLLRARSEWEALFVASRPHGKGFRLVRVDLETEFFGWQNGKITPCPKCRRPTGIGSHPSCPHGMMSEGFATRFNPVVVHVDASGNVRFPGRNDARVPAGYEKREMTNLAEVRAFTRQYNERLTAENQQRLEARAEAFSIRQSEERKGLRSAMQHMSAYGRDFAQFAMEMNDRRRRVPSAQSSAYFEVAEIDASNRDAHNDAMTGWKDRK